MTTFHDKTGLAWTLDLTIQDIVDVRREFGGLDLNGVMAKLLNNDPELFQEDVFKDSVKLVDLLFFLCREQAEARKFTAEQFRRGFDRPTIDRAEQAFIDQLVFFCSTPQTRAALQALVAKLREVGAKAMSQAEREIAEADAEKIIDGAVQSLRERRGSSPATLDLTPADTASVS